MKGIVGNEMGRLFVVSGPSGVGKGTLIKRLFSRLEGLALSVSATTRSPRPGEIDGVNYHFYSREQFEEGIERGYFFEYAAYNGNLYGSPAEGIVQQREAGHDVMMEIDVQGAMHVHELAPDAVLIYLKPPSLAELERRLRARRTESEERIQGRLAAALFEESFLARYNYVLVNDDLTIAEEILGAIVKAERKHKK